MSTMEAYPSLKDAGVLYQFDGSGNMHCGVQEHINTLARYMSVNQLATGLFVAEGDNTAKVRDQVFTAFEPSSIYIAGKGSRGITANGSQNTLAPVPHNTVDEYLNRFHPQIAHSMHPWQPQHGHWISQKLGPDVARVGTYHIDSNERSTNAAVFVSGLLSRHIGKHSLRNFDAMIAVSEVARNHMHRTHYYRGDAKIIPNAVNVDLLESAQNFDPVEINERNVPFADKYIVFVGRPDKRKGLSELLDATKVLNGLVDDCTDVQLVVCGDGPNRQHYEAYAQDISVRNVSFLGRVSDPEKARWLKTADFAVFPAKYGESQGIVLMEAMAAGSGVVLAGDNRGYSETMADLPSQDFVVFDPSNPAELANRIHALILSSALNREMHSEQQKLVRAKYDIEVVGKQILDVYARVIKS